MVRACLTTADFALAFHDGAPHGVEYSYDAFGNGFGITVGGGVELISKVRQFVTGVPAMGGWFWALERFISFVHPTTFLFRIDDSGTAITALTIYARFPSDPGPQQFETAMRSLHPFRWDGPATDAIAHTLGCLGPRGIGLRVGLDGTGHSAIYFRLDSTRDALSSKALSALAELCELSRPVTEQLLSDLRPLYKPGQIGVIGLDTRTPSGETTLKFNPPNIPLSLAVACVRNKGAMRARTNEIVAIAHGIRCRYASYLGMKYRTGGFAGARLYFSIGHNALNMPTQISVRSELGESPTLRAPHY